MKAFNVLYKHRHLYNSDTGKRIILNEHSRITITVDEKDVLNIDPYNPPHQHLLSEDELIVKLRQNGYYGKHFLPRGSELWFQLKAGFKTGKQNEREIYYFLIRLDEDLFWISRQQQPEKAKVMDCACTVVAEISGKLEHFEPIYAKSLNQAYTNTFEFFFPLYASATSDIYDKVALDPDLHHYVSEKRENLFLEIPPYPQKR